ncbi:MAG: DNA translocase FtsK [Pyrinomonadaceae bacterium]|nr:DNA translocase FtsK [Pyrinomonadaceae bacterium]
MATTHEGARARTAAGTPPHNTRRNEIVAIALFAASLLVALALVSYNPNDPSWNSAGQDEIHNLVGTIGANIAAALFQTFGLAAALVPVLLIVTAWRRFRIKRIHAPLPRVAGLVVLVLAAAALLALSRIGPLHDASFQAGGLIGEVIAQVLAGVFHTVGASVLLLALVATSLLLATNFSFAHAYERLAPEFAHRLTFFYDLPQKVQTWWTKRREMAQQHGEVRQAKRGEQVKIQEAEKKRRDQTGAERVAEFMRETAPSEQPPNAPDIASSIAIKRSAAAAGGSAQAVPPIVSVYKAPATIRSTDFAPPHSEANNEVDQEVDPEVAANQNGSLTKQLSAPAKRTAVAPSPSPPTAADDEQAADVEAVEAMLRDASVVRTNADKASASEGFGRSDRRAEATAGMRSAERTVPTDFKLPSLEFLHAAPLRREQDDDELLGLATHLAEKCREFNVTGQIKHICPGPVVTTYEFKPDPGVKYSRVTGLVDDLCLALKAESIRIERMPGKPHVGIEVPNLHRETIFLREVIDSRQFRESQSKLTLALGKTIDGLNYVADLVKMPHLLIAGATGTGKSVCLNSLVVSILYKAKPDEVKFIMIDPKRLELGLYADVPHLATPIITDPKRAASALKWAVREMEDRYRNLAKWGVRNIDGFNQEATRRNSARDFDEAGQPWKPLPYLVIIIDELADLMMVSGHEVEESITRLAQMARAVGIHLILATQRPSVDVITGLIKANFPSRISFRVSSKVDSRTILDANGSEQLLGRGDMLFLPPGTSRLIRVHGAYLEETEVNKIVAHVKAQGQPVYDETITQSEEEANDGGSTSSERDELFEAALRICVEMKRASTSVLQRRLRIGYGRAAAILDAMEREGFIGPTDGARPRSVLGRAYETLAHWDDLETDEG